MFRRNFTSKSKSLIKSSEWKLLKSKLSTQYPAFAQYLSTITKCLAERITFETEKFVVTLYYDELGEQLVLINPAKDIYIPSLPTCWETHFNENGIPILLVDPKVMKIVQGGAHLMAPGILGDIPAVLINQVVGVAILDNPRIVLALGVMQMNTQAIISDRSGKAVHIYHVYGDNLWLKSGKPRYPEIACPTIVGQIRDPVLPDEELDYVYVSKDPNQSDTQMATAMSTLLITEPQEELPDLDPETISVEDPDSEMHQAFLYGLVDLLASPDIQELSIAGSIFYSRYIQPHLSTPTLDFRMTKWKKLVKFLKAMEKEYRQSGTKLITLKEMSGGEMHLTCIFDKHPVLIDARSQLKKLKAANRPTKVSNSPEKTSARFIVTEMFQPESSMAPIFPDINIQLKRSDVYELFNKYYENAQLNNSKNQQLISVNAFLEPYAQSIMNAQSSLKTGTATSTKQSARANSIRDGKVASDEHNHVKRNELNNALLDTMLRMYKIVDTYHATERIETNLRRIEVFVDRRIGRKFVTVIKYLFLIIPELDNVQTELSTLCACSVSVGPYPGVAAAKGSVVQIQGDQTKNVQKWLTSLGIIHLVDFVDLGVQTKKKKK